MEYVRYEIFDTVCLIYGMKYSVGKQLLEYIPMYALDAEHENPMWHLLSDFIMT